METFSLDYALCTCLLFFALGCGVWFYFFCRAQRIKKVLQTLGSAAEVYAGILRQEKLRREQAYREQLRREAERRRQEEIRREQAFQEAERAKAEQEKNEAEINKIKVLFNGIWLTPQQFGFLQQNPVGNLRGAELRRYLAWLAECNPLFAEYRQEGCCGQKGGTENSGSGQNRAGQGTSSSQNSAQGKSAGTSAAAPNAYYRIFGLTPETLTEGSLKAAYRDLVKKYHPDTNRSPDAAEKFRKVKKVYAYLQEELRRKECSRSYAC